jgi:hypothetical protein
MTTRTEKVITLDTSEKPINLETTVVALSNDESEPQVLEASDPDDLLDPQNWSVWRKRLVFISLMSSSILCDG